MSNITDFKALRIKLASPEDIMSWSHGEVTKAETINYRTFRAEVDGLMDERIFGPTKDNECFCGKYKKVRYKGIVCDRCGVEVTHSRVRRERMGHVKLVSPVTHVWYSHGVPNKLAMTLDIPQAKLETVIYYARYLVINVDEEGQKEALERLESVKEEELQALDEEQNNKIEEMQEEFEQERKQLKKEEKDQEKLGVQTENLNSRERKEIAYIKSAYNQKRQSIEDKFGEMEKLMDEMTVGSTLSEEDAKNLDFYGFDFFQADMGAPAIKTLLESIDLDAEIKALDEEINNTKSEARKNKATQRRRLLKGMKHAGVRPVWMIMDVLPILPPDLRPIIQLPGGRFATSDLNDLYRRIINRNNRLRRLMELGAPEVILRNERRMLQESVDALLDNSHRPGSPTNNARGMPYKSLSDMLRGKQGRFRQNLLGKRVDYSGRAVIVSGPELEFHECGLPKNIALELFKPFIIRELIARGVATNPARARHIYEEQTPEVWDILDEVIKDRPVLLNRAPTLHKQGIQAFYPKLIEGNSIQLHPMVCRGYNADFDGDQMAVHLPLSQQAVEEAKERMMAANNMLSMASGEPIVNTEKDMAIGIYFLTHMQGNPEDAKHALSSREEAITRYRLNELTLYEPIKLRLPSGEVVTTTVGRAIFNKELPEDYPYINEALSKKQVQKISADIFNKYGRDIAIKVLNEIKNLGFGYATRAGFSIAMSEFDIGADDKVKEALNEYYAKENNLLQDYYDGLITREELTRLRQEEWIDDVEQIGEEVWQMAAAQENSNLVHLNNSGATPVSSWVKTISGVRGYVTDTSGAVVDLPLVGNYRKGLNNFEYFVAARNTRKSFADVALRTADSGYLTRRLVDVAQDVVIHDEDCGTEKGVELNRSDKRNQDFSERLRGRNLADNVVDPNTGEIVAEKDAWIDVELARKIEGIENIETVKVRSPLTCEATHGVCAKCYGQDFGNGEPVKVGEAVGVIAAQAIGEPTTQLTLKNKSDARAVGDVTQGLPRVEELFEVRTPRAKAQIADISGNVKVIQNEEDVTLRISTVKKMRKTYEFTEEDKVNVKRGATVKKGKLLIAKADGKEVKAPMGGKIEVADNKLYLLVDKEIESEMTVDSMNKVLVEDGEYVEQGQQLTYGSLDPKELAEYAGIERAQEYIIEGVQDVYGVYGIPLDDVHLEIIAAKMASYGQILDNGDSLEKLVGDFVSIPTAEHENAQLQKQDKSPIKYERVLVGLTNAALRTDSFLSAASFEQQVRVLTDASLMGKIDYLRGLKENVIIGRPVPIGDLVKKDDAERQGLDFTLGDGNVAEESLHESLNEN